MKNDGKNIENDEKNEEKSGEDNNLENHNQEENSISYSRKNEEELSSSSKTNANEAKNQEETNDSQNKLQFAPNQPSQPEITFGFFPSNFVNPVEFNATTAESEREIAEESSDHQRNYDYSSYQQYAAGIFETNPKRKSEHDWLSYAKSMIDDEKVNSNFLKIQSILL